MASADIRQQVVASAQRVVVKVGTQSICDASGRPDRIAIGRLAGQIAAALAGGVSITLVASGAIGAGLGELGLAERPGTMPRLQAAAAVGQGQLMRTFHDVFAEHAVRVAQVLVTRDDFDDRTRYLNIRNTLHALDEYGAVAIVNENDTVAVDEIRFGENDVLAAIVASMMGADLLVLLTVVDGLLAGGEVVDVIERVDDETRALVQGERSRLGSGGMGTKLQAADMMIRAGEAAVIANARSEGVLTRILAGERIGTVFAPSERKRKQNQKMSHRRRWIGQATKPAGQVVIDGGAARAIGQGGKSLLPSGITAVVGSFAKGAVVSVVDEEGTEIARGLTNYSSGQIEKIKGLQSDRIADALGDNPYDVVVHRDNMTVG